MTTQEIETALAQTLEDRRVSSSEKRALIDLLSKGELNNHQRNVLRNRAFALAREAIPDVNASEVVGWLEEVNKLLLPREPEVAQTTAEACFSPGPDCAQRIIGLLRNASRCADLCVFTIADDHITEAILAAHRRRVAIRIISDDQKSQDRGSDIEQFRHAGIPVRLDHSPEHMHHKFALFDQTTLVTGSFNWTRSASEGNQENIIVTDDVWLVKAFRTEFERLWQEV